MGRKHIDDALSLYSKSRSASKKNIVEMEEFKGHLLMDEGQEAQIAKKLIKRIPYLTLATSNRDGTPWNTPLYFANDEEYNFYWISSRISVHSVNIEENENVAIVIYDSTAPEGKGVGVYIKAKATVIKDETAIRGATELIYRRKRKPLPEFEEFVGVRSKRVYMATPLAVWVNDIKKKEGENKETRIKVRLE